MNARENSAHPEPAPCPARASFWQLRTRRLDFGPLPRLMGIVNATPDSFSDGGQFFDPAAAAEQVLQLIADGADVVDIGGESTRPYSQPVDAEEELRRVLPVIEAVRAAAPDAVLSIDTSKPLVACEALDAGVEIVNDVTAMTRAAISGEPAMAEIVARSGAAVCLMHMQGTPQTMQDDPRYDDVVAEVLASLRDRVEAAVAAGVQRERVCIDPGLGFGKRREHNLQLMSGCESLHALGLPVLIGHSRKGFLGKLLGDETADRDAATIGAALACVQRGVQVLRVHNVAAVRQALLAYEACGGTAAPPLAFPSAARR
jgi:dihydropteroate synthase